MRTLVWITVLGSATALALSLWPGWLNEIGLFGFLLGICLAPFAAVAFAACLIVNWKRIARHERRFPREVIAIPLIMLFSLALLVFYVPRRIAFRIHRQEFENMLVSVPQTGESVTLNRRAGIYHVDEAAADPRGGVYLRVYSGQDGMGPDRMSYGFVKKPNKQGSPFGRARYSVHALHGGWHWFHASDDY